MLNTGLNALLYTIIGLSLQTYDTIVLRDGTVLPLGILRLIDKVIYRFQITLQTGRRWKMMT